MGQGSFLHLTRPLVDVRVPVNRSVIHRQCACGTHTAGTGDCKSCGGVPPIVHDVVRSPGAALDAETRAFMEPRFGHDFSRVRVHTDEKADESARAVRASAYTAGSNVVFQTGQYAPNTWNGRALLAHELTHVVQQSGGANAGSSMSQVSRSTDAAEREAGEIASAIVNGPRVPAAPRISAAPATVHRLDWPVFVNGRVINNSKKAVRVWSGAEGHYSIAAGASSAHVGEDVDHIMDYKGQWYKISWHTVTVDSAGEVHDAACRTSSFDQACPEKSPRPNYSRPPHHYLGGRETPQI